MSLTLGFDCGYVPFIMTDTDVFLLQLLEALERGLVGESSERGQSALDEYRARVSEAIGEHVGSLSNEQIVAYNQNPNYPYWFAAYHHTHADITRVYHLVRPKDDWYHSYLTIQDEFANLSEEGPNAHFHQFIQDSP